MLYHVKLCHMFKAGARWRKWDSEWRKRSLTVRCPR